MRKGYMSVYLALTLTAILALVLSVIEGARISAIRMKSECVCDIGMNSVLAEYHREMLEQYDLLFVDMSYGKQTADISNTQAHLLYYLQNNLTNNMSFWGIQMKDFLAVNVDRAAIVKYSIASDGKGEVLKRQVTDYMRDYPTGMFIDLVSSWIPSIQTLDSRDIASERGSYEAQISSIGLPVEEVEPGVFEEVPLNNPADVANATRASGVLNLVLDDTSQLSKVNVDLTEYISHRPLQKGDGVCKEAEEITGTANDVVFQAYLFDKCGWYGQELEKSLLKYQIEYIIAGKDTDWENLEAVAKKLLRWREVANVIYILSDSGKVAEAEAMALALSAVTLMPALLEPVKYTILFAWAYLESLMDVRRLLKGGKVPLVKTAEDWRTGINGLLDVKGSLTGGDNGEQGLSYKEYLQAMLFLADADTRTMRAMDIMEMDIRNTPGNSHFKLDGCFDTYETEMVFSSEFGYQCSYSKLYGYY